jgi:serine/threonine protein kinase
LCAVDSRICYQFIRTLQNALMGKVKSAVVCTPMADGSFAAPSAPPYKLVAVKQLFKECIAKGVTLDGKRVKEDPMMEVAVLTYLGDPGHTNVLRLLNFLEDEVYYYFVYELLNGGELFDQIAAHGGGAVPEDTTRRYIFDSLQGASLRGLRAADGVFCTP